MIFITQKSTIPISHHNHVILSMLSLLLDDIGVYLLSENIYTMDHIALTALFTTHGKRAIDFIRWLRKNYNIEITRSELSLHMSGGRGINRWAEALYKIYFESLD